MTVVYRSRWSSTFTFTLCSLSFALCSLPLAFSLYFFTSSLLRLSP
jgi:hypothetical protein